MVEEQCRYASPSPDDRLDQGDIFWECPLPYVRTWDASGPKEAELALAIERRISVVLTPTCDLVVHPRRGRKAPYALVVPAYTVAELQSFGGDSKGIIENARRQRMFGAYYLPPYRASDERYDLPECILDLRRVFTLPCELLDALRTRGLRRLSIRPLYREHLSHWFAMTYFRIGLPPEDPTPGEGP